MQAKLLGRKWIKIIVPHLSLRRGFGLGIIGGLAATIVMDLILIIAFSAAGMPPSTCFSIVGDTLVRLFSFKGAANSAVLGAAAHYLIGPVLGAIFGAAGRHMPALQKSSWKKTILYAASYAEIVSQPLLGLTPIFLQMTASMTLLWYGGALMMHLVWGCVLGAVWNLGLQPARDVPENNGNLR